MPDDPKYNLRPTVATFGDASCLVTRLLQERPATGKEHIYQVQQIPSAAVNKQSEGVLASALSDTDTLPTTAANTCQIFSRKITVTGSAQHFSEQGLYGEAFRDMVANQTEMAMLGLMKDIEYAALWGVRNDTTQAQPWAMGGLFGARGTWNGIIANDTSGAGIDLGTDEGWSDFVAWLDGFFDLASGMYPDHLLVSSKVNRVIHDRVAAGSEMIYDPTVETLIGGIKVTAYRTPYGILKVIPHPDLAHDSTTATNNVIAALHVPKLKMVTARNVRVIPIGIAGDQTVRQLIYEGSMEATVQDAHGLYVNFTIAD